MRSWITSRLCYALEVSDRDALMRTKATFLSKICVRRGITFRGGEGGDLRVAFSNAAASSGYFEISGGNPAKVVDDEFDDV